MSVRLVPIPADVIAILESLRWPVETWERFNTFEDFDMFGRPPARDLEQVATGTQVMLDRYDASYQPLLEALGAERMTNAIVYPAGSIMGWHTNSDNPGVRRYYTWSEEGGAVFRYIDPVTGERHDSIDPPGWVCREFTVTRDPLFWHTVWTPVERWAYGVMMGGSVHS